MIPSNGKTVLKIFTICYWEKADISLWIDYSETMIGIDTIVIRNEKIVGKVVWIEYYLRLNLSSRKY